MYNINVLFFLFFGFWDRERLKNSRKSEYLKWDEGEDKIKFFEHKNKWRLPIDSNIILLLFSVFSISYNKRAIMKAEEWA